MDANVMPSPETEEFILEFTEEEYARIETAALIKNMTLGEFIAEAINVEAGFVNHESLP